MSESQNIEYKSSWHEEYLDWICGFANAQGGKIYIGKDDNGNVIGFSDYKDLMEKIPNKIKNQLGITAEVNLLQEDGKHYIEIVVMPYSVPISLRGRYFYRSGSVKQELTGAALNEFLLERVGKKWDSVPVPNVQVADLKTDTFTFFKEKGIKSNRIDEDSRNDTPLQVIENLKLIDKNLLNRAAVMLFHPDPEKYVSGAYIKIGFFRTDSDLLFQDEIHGNLFEQVEKTMDFLLTKYTKALISYEGLTRVETNEYPKDALREALLNAVAHKDYTGPYPIQISVYSNKIMIWNYGRLLENWTVEDLLDKHSSQPRNPDIATAFFRSGYVESWGRGMDKMKNLCLEAKIPVPQFSCKGNDFWTVFRKDIYNKEDLKKLGLNERQTDALLFFKAKGEITSSEYADIYNISDRTARTDLTELVEIELLNKQGETKLAVYVFPIRK
ncbi:MAG: putative DNA binding domain-containing protein [Candidatus Symbiothrix sp.]|jgi:ATP-dependent DNA helicase RecG|nr:putative DNA binding domain-containing protein [Candidatus Symbiothrix sp.]